MHSWGEGGRVQMLHGRPSSFLPRCGGHRFSRQVLLKFRDRPQTTARLSTMRNAPFLEEAAFPSSPSTVSYLQSSPATTSRGRLRVALQPTLLPINAVPVGKAMAELLAKSLQVRVSGKYCPSLRRHHHDMQQLQGSVQEQILPISDEPEMR